MFNPNAFPVKFPVSDGSRFYNDTASPFSIDTAISQCKKDHPVAKNLGKTVGGKPYTDCVARAEKQNDQLYELQKASIKAADNAAFNTLINSTLGAPDGGLGAVAPTTGTGISAMTIGIISVVIVVGVGAAYLYLKQPAAMVATVKK